MKGSVLNLLPTKFTFNRTQTPFSPFIGSFYMIFVFYSFIALSLQQNHLLVCKKLQQLEFLYFTRGCFWETINYSNIFGNFEGCQLSLAEFVNVFSAQWFCILLKPYVSTNFFPQTPVWYSNYLSKSKTKVFAFKKSMFKTYLRL